MPERHIIIDPRNRALMKQRLDELQDYDKMLEFGASTPVVKLFMADGGGRWFLFAQEKADNPDYTTYFGLCDLSMGFPEIGWVGRDELLKVGGQMGLGIEVDEHADGLTLADGYKYIDESVPDWLPV